MNHEINKTGGYIPALDGLRALSILLVVAGHVGLGNYVPGGLGVTTFFFISGYIICNLLISEYHKQGSLDLKLFYIRRILRLYPALLLMLTLTTGFVFFAGYRFSLMELFAALFYFENYYFMKAAAYSTLHYRILWSLAVEEHFYLVFPFILLVFARKNTLFLIVICVLILIALLIRIQIVHLYGTNEYSFFYTYTLTHCRFDSILYGCLLSLIIKSPAEKKFLSISTSTATFCTGILMLLFTFIYRDEFFKETFRYSVQGIALLILVSCILFNTRYEFINRLLSNRMLVYIGKLSYSIYLFHFLSEMICRRYLHEGELIWYVCLSLITIILSLFSYHVVEASFLKLRRKFGSHIRIAG